MTITRCLSSYLMSHLLEWRNPQGKEQNWYQDREEVTCGMKLKGITAELGIAALTASAVVESVVYLSFATLALFFSPCRQKIFPFFARHLQSSLFTVMWGVVSIILNPIKYNVNTHESFARKYLHSFSNCVAYRREDREFVEQSDKIRTESESERCLHSLMKEIFKNVPSEAVQAFKDEDSDIFLFIIAKAIFIYAHGSRKTHDIPKLLFSSECENEIKKLRKNGSKKITDQLTRTFDGQDIWEGTEKVSGYLLDACLKKVNEETAKTIFRIIWQQGSREQQGSFILRNSRGCLVE